MQRDANHLIPDGEIGRVAAILRQAVESPSGASARPRVRRSSADKPKARSVARKKFRPDEPIEFQHADAMALPFADASFDAVVCQFGVMFFPEKEKSYHKAYRVLAPGPLCIRRLGRRLPTSWPHRRRSRGPIFPDRSAAILSGDDELQQNRPN
jgi:SAM-dependent methyltransferase